MSEIKKIQGAARSGRAIIKPHWPVLILRTSKVCTCTWPAFSFSFSLFIQILFELWYIISPPGAGTFGNEIIPWWIYWRFFSFASSPTSVDQAIQQLDSWRTHFSQLLADAEAAASTGFLLDLAANLLNSVPPILLVYIKSFADLALNANPAIM